mmetsp:Transcript_14933/g.41563  ORF Transcript_14933/g.41563 Transcript_14933/m.41563 type:complete len:206 (+) Transcript_14933:2250-2867(+)
MRLRTRHDQGLLPRPDGGNETGNDRGQGALRDLLQPLQHSPRKARCPEACYPGPLPTRQGMRSGQGCRPTPVCPQVHCREARTSGSGILPVRGLEKTQPHYSVHQQLRESQPGALWVRTRGAGRVWDRIHHQGFPPSLRHLQQAPADNPVRADPGGSPARNGEPPGTHLADQGVRSEGEAVPQGLVRGERRVVPILPGHLGGVYL